MCPSEVSDIEHSLWQRYRDQGLKVWGIASRDQVESVQNFVDQYGITFPVLIDENSQVHNQYSQPEAFPSAAFPQDWIVDKNGIIVYVNNGFEVDAMQTIIENELEEQVQD